jgi:hypothetical protein
VATHGYARYRLPVLPVLFLLAAWTLTRPRDTPPGPRPAWRPVLAPAAAVVLAASLVPSLRLMARPGALVSEAARYAPGAGPEPPTTPLEEAGEK